MTTGQLLDELPLFRITRTAAWILSRDSLFGWERGGYGRRSFILQLHYADQSFARSVRDAIDEDAPWNKEDDEDQVFTMRTIDHFELGRAWTGGGHSVDCIFRMMKRNMGSEVWRMSCRKARLPRSYDLPRY